MKKRRKIFLALVFFFAGCLVAGMNYPLPAIADTGEQTLHAMIHHNWVAGYNLPSDIEVAVTINAGDKADFSITTDNNGHFFTEGWQYWPDQWISRGDIIEVSYGDQSVSMTVQNLHADVDLENNRILGTAFTSDGTPLEGRGVDVNIHEEWAPDSPVLHDYESLVDELGDFELGGDPESFEIQKGHKLFLSVYDSPDGDYAGHITSMEPYNGTPRLEVAPDHNWINGDEFPFNSPIDLSINADPGLTVNLTSDPGGHFWKNVWEFDYHLQAGDVIRAEYGAEEFVSVTLPDVTASADPDAGTVSGTAPGFEGQSIWIGIYTRNHEDLLHEAIVEVDQAGVFLLEWDGLEHGHEIDIVLTDQQNNEFIYHPYNPPTFDAGDGTPENPYQIADPEDLDNVRHHGDAHFILTGDIDLGVSPWNEGDGWEPIRWFSGVLDGGGHVVSNLTINRSAEDTIGLFAWLEPGGEIRNLGVINIDVSGRMEVGGLIGYNSGAVNNCYAAGMVSSTDWTVGGLVGENEDGLVANSYAMVDVTGYGEVGGLVGRNTSGIYNCYAEGEVTGTQAAGGLVGANEDGGIISTSYADGDVYGQLGAGGLSATNFRSTISNCYATGSVTGEAGNEWGGDYIGGLVGVNGLITADGEEIHPGLVKNSYAVGSVSGGEYVGGFIGSQGVEFDGVEDEVVGPDDIGEAENAFWNIDITAAGVGFGNDAGITGKTTVEMQTQSTFTDAGWDFDAIWAVEEGNYPYLLMGDYVPTIVIDHVQIQYRTHENSDWDIHRGWVGIAKDGLSLERWEIRNIIFRDAADNELDIAFGDFWFNENYMYDCFSGECSMSGLNFDSGFYCGFTDEIAAGEYEAEIETIYGQTETVQIYYPGKLELPVVSRSSMDSGYEGGDLVLNWINPTDQANWNAVDQLRIVLLDGKGNEILFVKGNPDDDAVVIPAGILDDAEAIHDTHFTRWYVQTRAVDENGMNYARGNSDYKEHGVSIDYPYLQYRTHEDEAMDQYRGWFGVTINGDPIEEDEIHNIALFDPFGDEIVLSGHGFWSGEYYSYSCSGGSCSVSGPNLVTGFGHLVENLEVGTYQVTVQTADGQSVTTEIEYPGRLELPVVKSSSMEAGFENDDVVFQWENPVEEGNWNEVQQLVLILFDEWDDYILSVSVDPMEETVAVPAHLIEDAESLRDTEFTTWLIQTRSYDANWMNDARGLSNRVVFDMWDEGSGTPEDPYLVSEPQDLSMMRYSLSSHFRLDNHIDMDGYPAWVPVGTNETPFTGGFDGNGYTVRNLFMNSSYVDYAGLFGYVQDAVIVDTGLEDADIRGRNHVGALIGYAQNTSVVECYVTGFVSGQDNVGGLTGTLAADTSSLISDSYADCDVDGGAAVGGLAGTLGASVNIENAYAVGSVQGDSDIGGLVGVNNDATHDNVVNSYWDTDIGPATSQGGTGKTTAEMMQQSTFTGWDFNATWAINEGQSYPYLQWQLEPPHDEYPNLVNWNGNLVADFGDNGLWYHDGASWNWMTNRGDVGQMAVWDGNLVVDFGADYGMHYYDGSSWTWMTNKADVALMLPWDDGSGEKLVVDFGAGRGIYTYDGTWSWFNNKDDVNAMAIWDGSLVVDFGNGRSVFYYDGGSWTWMTNKDDVAVMLPWDDGTVSSLVTDFGGGRGIYTYDGAWSWLNNKDDVNAMAVWGDRLVVDFGNGRAMFNYDGSWHWMTNKDDVTRMVLWNDGGGDKLAVDFGAGRGMYDYDGSWNWMKNADDVPEMLAWDNRLAVDFGSGVGIYNYDGTWNWMRNWSTVD